MTKKQKTQNIAILGLLVAVVIVLQMVSALISKTSAFPLNLAMIPIILAACMYGPKTSSILGFVFGVIVYICCILGWDVGGKMVFEANPLICAALVLIKGVASGFMAGIVAKPFMKKNKDLKAVVLSGIAASVVNTGIFIVGMLLFYPALLKSWAGGTEVYYYIIFTLIVTNFVIEFVLNLVMSTAISRVIKAIKKI